MTRPYRPSSGTEGMDFMWAFCDRCKRDAEFRRTQDGEKGCTIVADAYLYEISDPRYPKEWVQDEAGPRCTAFEPEGEP